MHFESYNLINTLNWTIFLKVNEFQIMGNKSLDFEMVLSDVHFVVPLPEVMVSGMIKMFASGKCLCHSPMQFPLLNW